MNDAIRALRNEKFFAVTSAEARVCFRGCTTVEAVRSRQVGLDACLARFVQVLCFAWFNSIIPQLDLSSFDVACVGLRDLLLSRFRTDDNMRRLKGKRAAFHLLAEYIQATTTKIREASLTAMYETIKQL